MARMKNAHWLGEHGSRSMSQVDIVCIHTIVGFAPAHAAHFSTHASGRLDQSRDTRFRSAANLDGNPRIIAIENEDHGPMFGKWDGSDVPPLTDEQVTACAEVLAFAHEEHGVPLQLCPDSKPGSRGLAYHRQGIDGNFGTKQHPFQGRVSGGEVWTESRGKVCPGDRRIAQLPEILRQAKAIVNGQPPKEPKMNPVQSGREDLAAMLKSGDKALAHFDDADPGREAVASFATTLRETLRILRSARKNLPEK